MRSCAWLKANERSTRPSRLSWQIKKLLTPKATKGWLGQALLPVGRMAFEQANPAWQSDNATELVQEGKALLADPRIGLRT